MRLAKTLALSGVVAVCSTVSAHADFIGRFRSTNGHVFCETNDRAGASVSCVSTDDAEPTLILRGRITEEEPPEPQFGCDGRVAYSIWSLQTTGGVRLKNTCTLPGLDQGRPGRFLHEGQVIHVGSISCRGGSYFDPIICVSRSHGFKLG